MSSPPVETCLRFVLECLEIRRHASIWERARAEEAALWEVQNIAKRVRASPMEKFGAYYEVSAADMLALSNALMLYSAITTGPVANPRVDRFG